MNTSHEKRAGDGAAACRINVEGPLFVPHSLAHVNRELCLALTELGVDVGVVRQGADDESLFGESRFDRLRGCGPHAAPEVVLRHAWPPDLSPVSGALRVHLVHWEFGALPEPWIGPLRSADEVWVLTDFVRDTLVRAGIDAERVHVIRGGVDPSVFHPAVEPLPLPTEKSFSFLTIGGPVRRKGLDLVLEAYLSEFEPGEDVSLIVKDVSAYGNAGRQQLYSGVGAPGSPEVVILDRDLSAAEMPRLYRAAGAVVQAYRGEALCLPILEAAASGTPVIATGRGAAAEYLNEDNALLIDSHIQPFDADEIDGVPTIGRPFFAEPDVAHLRVLMRRVFENRDEASARATRARTLLDAGWTWSAAARVVVGRLAELRTRQVRVAEALSLFVEGARELENDRPWEACVKLQQALLIEPCFPDALSEYGVALARTGRLEIARRVLTEATKLDPELALAQDNLSVVEQLLASHAGAGA